MVLSPIPCILPVVTIAVRISTGVLGTSQNGAATGTPKSVLQSTAACEAFGRQKCLFGGSWQLCLANIPAPISVPYSTLDIHAKNIHPRKQQLVRLEMRNQVVLPMANAFANREFLPDEEPSEMQFRLICCPASGLETSIGIAPT